jgi:hypothetical protein
MKNTQKGFAPIVLLLIIVVIAIGGGTYIYTQKKETPKMEQETDDSLIASTTSKGGDVSKNTSVNIQASTTVKVVPPKPKVNPIVLSEVQLKYKIKKYFNDKIGTCGPPVINSSYQDEQLALFSTIQANTQEFQEIIKNLNFTGVINFTNEQKLRVIAEHEALSAIALTSVNAGYSFQTKISTEKPGYNRTEEIVEGAISKTGTITITKRTDYPYGCPICLAKGTSISTPSGFIAVENLQAGIKVWTVNNQGEKIEAKIAKISKTPVPNSHYVTHLKLKDGRELIVSPNHPTIDGKRIGTLVVGEVIDGSEIVSTSLEKYTNTYTYDILPEGDTGAYWADGILIGSTLK